MWNDRAMRRRSTHMCSMRLAGTRKRSQSSTWKASNEVAWAHRHGSTAVSEDVSPTSSQPRLCAPSQPLAHPRARTRTCTHLFHSLGQLSRSHRLGRCRVEVRHRVFIEHRLRLQAPVRAAQLAEPSGHTAASLFHAGLDGHGRAVTDAAQEHQREGRRQCAVSDAQHGLVLSSNAQRAFAQA